MASKLIDLLNKRRCRTWRPLAAHTEPTDGHVGHEAFAGACDYGTDDDSSVDETPAECTCFNAGVLKNENAFAHQRNPGLRCDARICDGFLHAVARQAHDRMMK